MSDEESPASPRSRLLLTRARSLARHMGDDFLGAEHLLLACLTSDLGERTETIIEGAAAGRDETVAVRIPEWFLSFISGDRRCKLVQWLDACPAWQPIETAPKDGTAILVFGIPELFQNLLPSLPNFHVTRWSRQEGHEFKLIRGNLFRRETDVTENWSPRIKATHWMPLPKEPQ